MFSGLFRVYTFVPLLLLSCKLTIT